MSDRWPQMMKRSTAAEYLDMGPEAFSSEVKRGRLPKPVTLGGADHWHKPDIDAAVDRLFGNDPADAESHYINYDAPIRHKPKRSALSPRTDDMAYSVSSLAERWTCSEGLVRKLIKRGELPAFNFGKVCRIKSADVASFERGDRGFLHPDAPED